MSDSFVTLRAVTRQAPLSVGFPRQEHWSGLPLPSPGDLPHPGIKPVSWSIKCHECVHCCGDPQWYTAASGPWQATRSFRSHGGPGAAGRKPAEWTPHVRFLNTLCVSHVGLTLLSRFGKVTKKTFLSTPYGPPRVMAAPGCLWSARLLTPWATFPDLGLQFPSLTAPQSPTHP